MRTPETGICDCRYRPDRRLQTHQTTIRSRRSGRSRSSAHPRTTTSWHDHGAITASATSTISMSSWTTRRRVTSNVAPRLINIFDHFFDRFERLRTTSNVRTGFRSRKCPFLALLHDHELNVALDGRAPSLAFTLTAGSTPIAQAKSGWSTIHPAVGVTGIHYTIFKRFERLRTISRLAHCAPWCQYPHPSSPRVHWLTSFTDGRRATRPGLPCLAQHDSIVLRRQGQAMEKEGKCLDECKTFYHIRFTLFQC